MTYPCPRLPDRKSTPLKDPDEFSIFAIKHNRKFLMIFSPRYCLFLIMLDPENRIFKCNWMVVTFSTQATFQDIKQSKNIGHFLLLPSLASA